MTSPGSISIRGKTDSAPAWCLYGSVEMFPQANPLEPPSALHKPAIHLRTATQVWSSRMPKEPKSRPKISLRTGNFKRLDRCARGWTCQHGYQVQAARPLDGQGRLIFLKHPVLAIKNKGPQVAHAPSCCSRSRSKMVKAHASQS